MTTETKAPAILPDARERWLRARRNHIGASDAAAILGADPRRGPLAVYASKVSDQADEEERRWMAFGRRVEGAISDWYADETGRDVLDLGAFEILRHPDLPFIGATLDRAITAGSAAHPRPPEAAEWLGIAPLEAKAVAGFKAQEWREEPPQQFQVQLQVQLACTGASWGSLCALMGGVSLVWRDILRHDAFLAAALPKLEEFWARVQRREPPEADARPATSEAIRRLWSTEDGEKIALDADALEIVEAWERFKVVRGDAEDEVKDAENRLRVLLGSASFAALPDGSMLSLRLTERKGYEVKPATFRQLRRFRPRLARR